MKTAPSRIQLKGEGVHEEGRAAATITPGMLVTLNTSGNVIPHGTAGGTAEKAFALEDALQGNTIEDDYASGDLVSYSIQRSGDVVYAWLAAGENVTPADYLSSNGAGLLKEASGGDIRLARPLETLDLSDTDAENTRIRVRIL